MLLRSSALLVQIGDVDLVSALIGAVGCLVAVLMTVGLYWLAGYKVKAELSISTRFGDFIGPEQVAHSIERNPQFAEMTEAVLAVRFKNTRRSPVTVSAFHLENAKSVRQKWPQKLYFKKGYRMPWVPGPAMTQAKLPVKLGSYDEETLVYPLFPAEFSAGTWCVFLNVSQTKVRGVIRLGNGKTVKTNKIVLPRKPLDPAALRQQAAHLRQQPAFRDDGNEVPLGV